MRESPTREHPHFFVPATLEPFCATCSRTYLWRARRPLVLIGVPIRNASGFVINQLRITHHEMLARPTPAAWFEPQQNAGYVFDAWAPFAVLHDRMHVQAAGEIRLTLTNLSGSPTTPFVGIVVRPLEQQCTVEELIDTVQ